ncbi:response regulator transcription factor [Pantoea sp. B9002]|nr:response regulator transcription factor [Pantoea sp. B9002]
MLNKNPPIKVAILDDHPLIRKALHYSLEYELDLNLVGMYKNRQEITSALQNGEIDLLVLDYLLAEEDFDGLQLVKHFRLHYPKLKILVSSAIESPAVVNQVIKAGVMGFVGKSKEQEELIAAIRKVASGKRYLSTDMQHELDMFNEPDADMYPYIAPSVRPGGKDIEILVRELTPREMEVIRCYLAGLNITQIAEKFNRSRKTISGQKQGALRKLGMKSDVELFRYQDLIIGL